MKALIVTTLAGFLAIASSAIPSRPSKAQTVPAKPDSAPAKPKTPASPRAELIVSGSVKNVPVSVKPAVKPPVADKSKATSSSKPNSSTKVIAVNQKQAPAVVKTELLRPNGSATSRVVVDLSRQRAYLIIDEKVAIDTPVSTGKKGHETKPGAFKVSERIEKGKVSNLYKNAPMPYWQRIGQSPIGMHVGIVPGYPASHGCVRLPQQIAPLFYSGLRFGAPVEIVRKWDGVLPAGNQIAKN